MANTGVGATLVLTSGSTYTGRWKLFGAFNQTVEALDDTALSSTDYKEFVPDDLASVDPINVELYAGLSAAPPVVGTVCTATITFPRQTGQTNAAVLTGTAIITAFNQPELSIGTRLMSNMTLQFDGKTGPTFTPAT